MPENKSKLQLSYESLPEARKWSVGSNYKVRLFVKQVGQQEDGVTLEVNDATSLEPRDMEKRVFTPNQTIER